MSTLNQFERRQRATVFVGLLMFALILFLIQLWLFVLVLENLFDGNAQVSLPATIATVILFGINVWMLRGVFRLLGNH